MAKPGAAESLEVLLRSKPDFAFDGRIVEIFPESVSVLKEKGVDLHALCTWWDVLAYVERAALFPPAQLAAIKAFLNDPVGWSRAHGGKED